VAAFLVVLIAGVSSADASENVSATLLSERAAIEPGRPFHVGLLMKMRRGWHTYWKNPGDSGMPLRITWSLPAGFKAGPIEWPAPERIAEKDLMSYGYDGEVLIPVEITPPAHVVADSVTIAGTFEWLECKDICLPGSATLNISLPVRPGQPAASPNARAFAKARSRIPTAPIGWSFAAEAGPRAISLGFHPPPGIGPRRGYLFVDQPLVADYAAPQGFERIEGGYRVTVRPAANASGTLDHVSGVLVVEGGSTPRTAVQVNVPLKAGDPAPARVQPEGTGIPTSPYALASAIAGLGVALLLLRAARSGRRRP
jgi:DsbC/DsbD-like thiol-disulfide interchange protein